MDKIADADRKFEIPGGDPDFSPLKNKEVIENSIKKYEMRRAIKRRQYAEQVRERSDAVVSYLKSKAADSGKPIEAYLGKTYLAKLQGQRIVQKIKRLASGKQYIEFDEI